MIRQSGNQYRFLNGLIKDKLANQIMQWLDFHLLVKYLAPETSEFDKISFEPDVISVEFFREVLAEFGREVGFVGKFSGNFSSFFFCFSIIC